VWRVGAGAALLGLVATSAWSQPTPESLSAPLASAIAATTPDRVLTLDNGLVVVLRRDPAQPVVAVQMYYKVGARHETIGITGIAHYLEHMLFRGTDHFGLADITGVIERAGGEWHGYTWLDGTTFFEAAPKGLLPTLLKLEAERMTVARMAKAEVDPERGAVFQEYRGYQLDPRSDLFDAVMAILFLQHPYRNNTMGWESDLAAITHADLVAFYQRYYGPKNAVLAIDGDIDLDAAEKEVRKVFDKIEARGDSVVTRTVEPPVEGTRRVTLKRDGARRALLMSWLAPAATRPRDYAALMLLDAVLDKPRGLSFEHHSGDLTEGLEVSPAGRLWPVVDQGPAESLGTAFVPMVYPGHYSIYATLKPERAPADLEKAINSALRGARDLPAANVEAARRLILAADSVETDSPLEAAHEMAFWTALGGAGARRAVLEALADVTVAEVHEMARRFTPDRAAIGWLLPTEGSDERATPAAGEPPPRAKPTGAKDGCRLPGGSYDLIPARVAQVAGGQWSDGSGGALIDSRPGLTTFALRFTIAATELRQRWPTTERIRDVAQALAADREAAARAAANGVELTIVAPGNGRFDERDTLQIEMTGPAASLSSAMQVLESALPAALDAPPRPGAAPDRPEGLALSLLETAVTAAQFDSRAAAAPGLVKGPGGQNVERVVPAPARPKVFFALVGPFGGDALGRRYRDLAACAIEKLAPPDSTLPGTSSPAPTASRAPFKPGHPHLAVPGIVQGRLLIAIPGDADPVVQDAVAWLLHHNYSGRLGVAAIAETGLVYEMESESARRGAPLAWFSMGAEPAKLVTLTRILGSVIDTVVRDGFFTDAEIASFRSFAAGRATVRLAHPDQAARFWTSVLLRGGDNRTPALEAARAADLSGEVVREAARRMLVDAGRFTATVGAQQAR
jgi:zinc protease